jgi:hypothetical protein
MIGEQRELVAWRTVNVTPRQGNPDFADQRSLISMADAERDTHITQQQVSRWRKALDR